MPTFDSSLLRSAFLGAIVAMAILTVAYGGATMFNQFAVYDDEGTMLFSLAGVQQGRHLYDEIVMPYGPAFFQLAELPFLLFPLTTENGRIVVLLLGYVLVILSTMLAWRLTRDALLTLATVPVSVLLVFAAVSSEPLHPVSLTMLLSLLVVGSVILGGGRSPRAEGLVAGVAVALLLLSKLNLGVYLLGAIVLASVLISDARAARWLKWVVGSGLVVMPIAVANKQLLLPDRGEALQFALLIGAATAALVFAGIRFSSSCSKGQREWAYRWSTGALAGGLVATGLSIGGFLLTGGDLRGLVDGVALVPARLGATFYAPIDLPFGAVSLAVLAAVFCFGLLIRGGGKRDFAPRRIYGLARLGAGIAMLAALVAVAIANKGAIVLPLVLAWVILIPNPRGVESPLEGYGRLLLVSVAVVGSLGMFPVSGSQVPSAALLFLPVAILSVSDGLSELALAARAGEGVRMLDDGTISLTRVAVLAAFAPALLVSTVSALADFRAGVPIPRVREASLLRLEPSQAEELGDVVAAVREEGCTALLTYPPRDSLVLWTDLERQSPMALQNWPWLYTREQQEQLVRDAGETRMPCLLRDPELLEVDGGLCSADILSPKVVRYLCGTHELTRRVGPWELLTGYPS